MYGIIYKITNKINGKIYIGQTIKSLKERWSGHLTSAHHPQPRHAHIGLYLAINKYGAENFDLEVIDEANSEEELNEKEIYWIRYFDSYNTGYNMTTGGNQNRTFDYSKHPDAANIKRKMSESKLGGKNNRARKVKCKNIVTGEELFFDSFADAARYFRPNINTSNKESYVFIGSRCSGKAKKPYKNEWLFAYQENDYPTDYKVSKSPTMSQDIKIQVTDSKGNIVIYNNIKELTQNTTISSGTFSTNKNQKGNHFKLKEYIIDIIST